MQSISNLLIVSFYLFSCNQASLTFWANFQHQNAIDDPLSAVRTAAESCRDYENAGQASQGAQHKECLLLRVLMGKHQGNQRAGNRQSDQYFDN